MPAAIAKVATTLDPTSIPDESIRIGINGQIKDGLILEGIEFGAGTTYDVCSFTVAWREDITNQVQTVGTNKVLQVAGGYGAQYAAGDEVTVLFGPTVIWRGFVARRLLYPNLDAVTYIAHDIRWMMRENVAGARFVYDGGNLATYTHRREVFNERNIGNKHEDYLAFVECPTVTRDDGVKGVPWSGPDIVAYLRRLREDQYSHFGSFTPVRSHKQGIVSNEAKTTELKLIPDTLGEELVLFSAGLTEISPTKVNHTDFNGVTFVDALERVGKMYGFTLATGPGGLLRYVRVENVGDDKYQMELVNYNVEGVELETDFTNSYAGAVHYNLPDAVERTVTLKPAWTDEEQVAFCKDYARFAIQNLPAPPADTDGNDGNPLTGNIDGDEIDLVAFGRAANKHWRVFAVYYAPLIDEAHVGNDGGTINAMSLPLPHNSRVDKFTLEPLKNTQLWYDVDGLDTTYNAISADRAGMFIDKTSHTINLWGLRAIPNRNFAYDKDAWQVAGEFEDGGAFTRRNVKMVVTVEDEFSVRLRRTAIATDTDHPTLGGFDNSDYSIENNTWTESGRAQVKATVDPYHELPPPVVAWNLGNSRFMRVQGSTLGNSGKRVGGTNQDFVLDALPVDSNAVINTFYSGAINPNIEMIENEAGGTHDRALDEMTGHNAEQAMRLLRATRPQRRMRMAIHEAMVGFRIGDHVSFLPDVASGNWPYQGRHVITGLRFGCAGREGGKQVVDKIAVTEITMG